MFVRFYVVHKHYQVKKYIIMLIRFHAVKRLALLLFGENKVKRARKPLKKVGYTGEGKR